MAALLTLAEAKAALNLEDADPVRDELVMEYVEGVTSVVEARVGWVAQRTEVLKIRQGGCEVALPGRNIISLTSGVYDRTQVAIDTTGMDVGIGGVLRYVSGAYLPLQPWTLTAVVGLSPIPAEIKRGAAEILNEAWALQRGPGAGEIRPFLTSYRAEAWFAGSDTGPSFS